MVSLSSSLFLQSLPSLYNRARRRSSAPDLCCDRNRAHQSRSREATSSCRTFVCDTKASPIRLTCRLCGRATLFKFNQTHRTRLTGGAERRWCCATGRSCTAGGESPSRSADRRGRRGRRGRRRGRRGQGRAAAAKRDGLCQRDRRCWQTEKPPAPAHGRGRHERNRRYGRSICAPLRGRRKNVGLCGAADGAGGVSPSVSPVRED